MTSIDGGIAWLELAKNWTYFCLPQLQTYMLRAGMPSFSALNMDEKSTVTVIAGE
jgi:hypothetical protein